MKYTESKKPAMKFVGFGINTSVQTARQDCPQVWEKFMQRYKEIKNYVGGMKNYGVCINPKPRECTFRYVASAEVNKFDDLPEGMEEITIPAENYFVFIHKGKLEKVGDTYMQIMETIPKTNKVQKGGFWVEFYDHRWKGDKEESEYEIWIPVGEKK